MGFGWMFLGYILLLGTNLEIGGFALDITPDVIGFLLLSRGFNVASQYCECFRVSKMIGVIGIPLSFAYGLLEIVRSLELLVLSPTALLLISTGYSIFKLIFSLCLLYSLYLISAQTGVEKLRKKSIRLAIYTVLFFFAEHFIGDICTWLGMPLASDKLAGAQMVLGILCILINATLIFGCYMWICLEGDEDMPDNRKHKYKTPFDFFDKEKAEAELRKSENSAHKQKKKR